jgi:sarcosine oxidase, subunit beta
MKTYDAVVIGGGVIGASIASHLAKKGFGKICVIDKGSPGSGSTGKATGGYRAQFGSEINIKLSLLSKKKLLSFQDETGIDPGYKPFGYLFLAQNKEELARLKDANALQKKCGVGDAVLVTTDEIKSLNPYIEYSNITGGTFCQSDGFITPLNLLQGYSESAKKHGAEFIYNREVTSIEAKDGRITHVNTLNESYSAGIVINAAGAWAGLIGQMAGATIPVTPLKRQVCRILEQNTIPYSTPMTIWVDNSFHFRMRDNHLILLMPCEPENNDDLSPEKNWLRKVLAAANERLPLTNNCHIDYSASWAGLYEISPDEHVLLGLAPGFSNLYLACGSSGHGVMHSPAIGQLVSELIMDEANAIDISSLSPNRFNEGKPISSIEFF